MAQRGVPAEDDARGAPDAAAQGAETPPLMGHLPAVFGTGLQRWRRYRVVVALHRAGYRGPWEPS
jgi:hypothetical protein